MTLSDKEIVRKLGPVGQAFFGRFSDLRQVQQKSLASVLSGKNVLITSATASGKTEAALAPLLTRIRSCCSDNDKKPLLLAIAPTRALVNDLHSRIEGPLAELNWRCGRQTSDHREKRSRPEVLITTPESFDSMLVRDAEREDGILKGHLLSGIEAVFIDEAHLFQASPRGAQVTWLLGRLRRLKSYAKMKGWTTKSTFQVVAASATVSNPKHFSNFFLGDSSDVVFVPGRRHIEVVSGPDGSEWKSMIELNSLDCIFKNIIIIPDKTDLNSIARFIWNSIKEGATTDIRKVLVFVPSRAMCDLLALCLSDMLKTHREIYVGAHHGSLERDLREEAERIFSSKRDGVLVATTTLEVGIDIGDVDVVAILGPPPDTSSLLQRIGRSGRRKGCVRILPIVNTQLDGRAFASMLDSAHRGALDPVPIARLWSVFIQQAASHVVQAGSKGRLISDLLEMAQDVWPENSEPVTAQKILEHLVETEDFVRKGNRLFLGESWSDRFERAGGDFHHNFESGNQGVPVINATTGDVLTHVTEKMIGTDGVAFAGQRWEVVSETGEISIKSSTRGKKKEKPFLYATKAAPKGIIFAAHVRRGLGFTDVDAPVVFTNRQPLWFHFGGSAYEAIILSIIPDLTRVKGLFGIALRGIVTQEMISIIKDKKAEVLNAVYNSSDTLVSSISLGRYHNSLPPDVRSAVVFDVFGANAFFYWLSTRKIFIVGETQESYRKIVTDLDI